MGLRLCSRHLIPEYQLNHIPSTTEQGSSCYDTADVSQDKNPNSTWQVQAILFWRNAYFNKSIMHVLKPFYTKMLLRQILFQACGQTRKCREAIYAENCKANVKLLKWQCFYFWIFLGFFRRWATYKRASSCCENSFDFGPCICLMLVAVQRAYPYSWSVQQTRRQCWRGGAQWNGRAVGTHCQQLYSFHSSFGTC